VRRLVQVAKRRIVFARLNAKTAARSAERQERVAVAGQSGSEAADAFWTEFGKLAEGEWASGWDAGPRQARCRAAGGLGR
jgi:hypothetical protein